MLHRGVPQPAPPGPAAVQGTLPTPLLLGRHRQASQWTQAGEQPEVSPHLQSRLLWAVGFKAPCPPGLRSAVPSRTARWCRLPAQLPAKSHRLQTWGAAAWGPQPRGARPTSRRTDLRRLRSAPRPLVRPSAPAASAGSTLRGGGGGGGRRRREGGSSPAPLAGRAAQPGRRRAAARLSPAGSAGAGGSPAAPPGGFGGGIWQSRLAARLGSAGEGAWSPPAAPVGRDAGVPPGITPAGRRSRQHQLRAEVALGWRRAFPKRSRRNLSCAKQTASQNQHPKLWRGQSEVTPRRRMAQTLPGLHRLSQSDFRAA